ncbi:MAG: putative ABC transporter permease [Firmicutes bacterium]|nr:putative ABC transporter permease [Bacillota bacterium]
MEKLLFLFMLYAVIGWLWETPYVSFNEKKFINRGFLRGPYIPIYGSVCMTLILSMSLFESLNQNNPLIILFEILFVALVSAIYEYVTSYVLEKVFKTRWWDYSTRKFNLNGRIALDYTILFGIGGYILWRFVNPVFTSLYDEISPNYMMGILGAFYTIFIIDNYLTFKDLFQLRNIIIKLDQLRDDVSEKYDEVLEFAYHSIQTGKANFSKTLSEYKNLISVQIAEMKNEVEEKVFKRIENRFEQLSNMLEKSARLRRFYVKYPKTPTKNYLYHFKFLKRKK